MEKGSKLKMAHTGRDSTQQEALHVKHSLVQQLGQQWSSYARLIALVKKLQPLEDWLSKSTPDWHTLLQAARTCRGRACVPPDIDLYFGFRPERLRMGKATSAQRGTPKSSRSPRLLLPAEPQPHPSTPGGGREKLSPGLPEQMKKGDFLREEEVLPGLSPHPPDVGSPRCTPSSSR